MSGGRPGAFSAEWESDFFIIYWRGGGGAEGVRNNQSGRARRGHIFSRHMGAQNSVFIKKVSASAGGGGFKPRPQILIHFQFLFFQT